jgi:hypothetical protein
MIDDGEGGTAMAVEENMALARRWSDLASDHERFGTASSAGDSPAAKEELARSKVSGIFSPDTVMHFPDGNGSIDRINRYHLMMMDAFPDVSFTIDDLLAEGDTGDGQGKDAGDEHRPLHGQACHREEGGDGVHRHLPGLR